MLSSFSRLLLFGLGNNHSRRPGTNRRLSLQRCSRCLRGCRAAVAEGAGVTRALLRAGCRGGDVADSTARDEGGSLSACCTDINCFAVMIDGSINEVNTMAVRDVPAAVTPNAQKKHKKPHSVSHSLSV